MYEELNTRNHETLLDEAETRAADLAGLVGIVSDETEYNGALYVGPNSNKETFDLANINLNSYKRISDVSLSLQTPANDVYELVSKASIDALTVADNALMKRLTDILDNAFNAGYQYATDAASGVDVDREKLDQDMATKQNELLALFGVREAR